MGKKDKRQTNTPERGKLNNSEQSRNGNFQIFLAIVACIILPFVIYSNSLHAPFIFDDMGYIVENPRIRQVALPKIDAKLAKDDLYNLQISRPLTSLTFSLNHYYGKLNTFGYHLVNVLLHILNTILIFFLTRKILFYMLSTLNSPVVVPLRSEASEARQGRQLSIFIPLGVALLFASHPMNAEAVTYISHRSESLATFFYLGALLFFIKTFEKNKIFYLLSLMSFVLSLMSKEIAATLPAMILIFDYIFLSDFKMQKVIEKKFYHLSYWVLLFIFLIVRRTYLGQVGDVADVTYKTWTHATYFITQIFVVAKYLKLLFVPIGQCIDHFILPSKTFFESRIIMSSILIAGMLLIALLAFRKRTVLSKQVLFSILWFFITLTPTSSFLPINDAMAERRVYLPGWGFSLGMISLYMLICWEYAKGILKIYQNQVLLGLILVHILLLSLFTWKRNLKYQNPLLLWQEAVHLYPNNHRAHLNVGYMYYELKEYDKAIESFQTAISLRPDYAGPYYNLGNLYTDLNNYEKAKDYFEKEIFVNPKNDQAYDNLGLLYYKQGKYDKAEQCYQKAIELNQNNAEAYGNMGNLCKQKLQLDKAEQYYKRVIEINPDIVGAYINLGYLYLEQKKWEEARQQFEIALKLMPNDQIKGILNLIGSNIPKGVR